MNRILKTLLLSMIVISSGYALSGGTLSYFYDTEVSAGNSITAGTWGSPPDASGVHPNISCLWPPNHQFVNISIEGVFDPNGMMVEINITNITSDEPTDEYGDGTFAPDAYGIGTGVASLRAERSGTGDVGQGNSEHGNGRVYMITFVASDGVDDDVICNVTVCVPHNQSVGCVCTDDGQIYDATVIMPTV
jgi:predicted ribosomally synthesized peptide with SipW-like signal peptide